MDAGFTSYWGIPVHYVTGFEPRYMVQVDEDVLESKINCFTHEYIAMACLEKKFAPYFVISSSDSVEGLTPHGENGILLLKNEQTLEMLNITDDMSDEPYEVQNEYDISALGNCTILNKNDVEVTIDDDITDQLLVLICYKDNSTNIVFAT